MRHSLSGLFIAGLILAGASQASAAPATCTTFTGANGTSALPGTFVGTVGMGLGQVCQIGNISGNNVSGTGTYVNNSQTTSYYSFYWDGGALSINEELGNNGIGDAVDVSLGSIDSLTSTSPSATLASITIPFTSGPSGFYTVSDLSLAAGYYEIENQLAQGVTTDPTYQVNFSSPVPEPATLALLLAPLTAVFIRRRRQIARI